MRNPVSLQCPARRHEVRSIPFVQQHRYWFLVIAVLVAVAAFVAFEFATAPRIEAVSPGVGSSQSRDSLTVSIQVPGAERLSGLDVRLDGRDVTPVVRSDAQHLYFPTGRLAQGEHVVSIHARTSNLLLRSLTKTWRFAVDTVAAHDRPAHAAAACGRHHPSPGRRGHHRAGRHGHGLGRCQSGRARPTPPAPSR